MKIYNILILILFISFASCDVDQTKEMEMPDVDIDVDAGQLPSFDVDWAEVNVGTTTETIKVPKVVVVMEEVEVEVPYVDVDMPGEDKEKRNIIVEAEVSDKMHKIEIQEVYATGNKMIVISRLEPTDEDLGDNNRVRVSDRLVLNATDLDVKHYVIGKRPAGEFNSQYSYISSKEDIKNKLTKGKAIYQR